MDTDDGADRALWVRVFGTSAGRAVPAWHGTGDEARLRLTCGVKSGRGGKSGGGCQNTPEISPAEAAALLNEIWALGSTRTRRQLGGCTWAGRRVTARPPGLRSREGRGT
jgi:hypothetical protein